MHKSSIFMAIVAGFGVFVFFSVDILREVYGPSALLAIYAVVAILTALAIYSVIERMYSITKKEEDTSESDGDNPEDPESSPDEEIIEKEVESLKEQEAN